MEEGSQGPHGIGATTETEEINRIAIFVLVHEEDIGVTNVVHEASAERQPLKLRPETPELCGCEAGSHGSQSRMVVGDLAGRIFQQRIDFDDVRVVVAELFPGAVTTDGDIFRHGR